MITGLLISNFYLFSDKITGNAAREQARVGRVIDGDTLKLEDGRTIRLLNINSPEKGTIGANLSYIFLKSFENQTVEVEIIGTDKYKRSLARIYDQNSVYINMEIVSRGLASKFLVQESELSDFANAEKKAIENSLGIWKRSPQFGCFKSEIDKDEEIIILTNTCDSTNVASWMLKDESRKIYKFKNINLGQISLHSSDGTENSTDLFWNSQTNVWNSDRDTLYLFDSNGGIVQHESYGY